MTRLRSEHHEGFVTVQEVPILTAGLGGYGPNAESHVAIGLVQASGQMVGVFLASPEEARQVARDILQWADRLELLLAKLEAGPGGTPP